MMTEKIKPICPYCGSSDVVKDASAKWSFEKQEWELITTYDNSDCNNCGQGTNNLSWIGKEIK